MNGLHVVGRRHPQAWLAALALLLVAALAIAQPPPRRVVLVHGDSLSAAYNLRADQGWVALLGERLQRQSPPWQVVNASISGETSAGGRARILADLARHRPAVVVIELGANDALRGLPLEVMRANLAWMIGAAHGAGARVLLVGMRMPPNLGPDYTAQFADSYAQLARRFDVALLPFLLEPIAERRENFQDDNLHPVAAAQPALRDHVWQALAPLLR